MSDSTPAPTGDQVVLIVPASREYLEIVTHNAQSLAGLAGFGAIGAGRARLLAEEVFLHICAHSLATGRRGECRLELATTPDGMSISFITEHLAYDPDPDAAYSPQEVLEDGPHDGLGLHLVRAYAQNMTFTHRGAQRELLIALARGESEAKGRPWNRMVPRLSPTVSISPMEHQGRLLHRMDDKATGKSFLMRPLAHQIINLIDGQASFENILSRTLKVMPERSRLQVEEIFEVLIQKSLVEVSELPRAQAEVEVRKELQPQERQGLAAYKKALDGE